MQWNPSRRPLERAGDGQMACTRAPLGRDYEIMRLADNRSLWAAVNHDLGFAWIAALATLAHPMNIIMIFTIIM
jgi:hypothetical protein